MQDKIHRVLFLSRRNSARSILAEALLNRDGKGRFKAYSAGVLPPTTIDPLVLELLKSVKLPTEGLKSKHYREFAASGAEDLDFVFTLSDTAAGEPLPEWPGMPVTAHWSCPDPVLMTGEEWERKQAFGRVMTELERRLHVFANLPFKSLDKMSLKMHVDEIGKSGVQ